MPVTCKCQLDRAVRSSACFVQCMQCMHFIVHKIIKMPTYNGDTNQWIIKLQTVTKTLIKCELRTDKSTCKKQKQQLNLQFIATFTCLLSCSSNLPSVLWHCWLGGREGTTSICFYRTFSHRTNRVKVLKELQSKPQKTTHWLIPYQSTARLKKGVLVIQNQKKCNSVARLETWGSG